MEIIKVEKVTIRIKDIMLELTVEEAKELRGKLNELLGGNYWYWHPHPCPTLSPPWIVTSGSSGDTTWITAKPVITSGPYDSDSWTAGLATVGNLVGD